MGSGFASFLLPGRALPGELVLRRRLIIRLGIFVFMECAFIALAIACLSNPLPCSISPSPTLAKASFTVLFIAWQTVAIMCGQEVALHGFSSEWQFRFHKTGNLSPGHTDLISTITSGLGDRVRYFFSRTASVPYRLSFVAFWLLVALAGIAPGSMTVDVVPRFTQTAINITNFTLTGGDTNSILLNPIIRAGLVSELELRENTPFKFATEDHVIVGWPNIDPGQLTGDMEFESDVLLFDMKCRWEAPNLTFSQWNTTWHAGGYAWYPWMTPFPGRIFDGGMLPMFRFSTEQEFTPHRYPNPLPAVDPVGLSGYLFFGRNSSFPPDVPSTRRNLNMDGLPTTFNDSGFHFISFDSADSHFDSPLATFLLCDPQARILDGRLLLSQANSSITVKSTSPPTKGGPKIGNISPDAANVILGLTQMNTLECGDESAVMRIGALTSRAFLNDTSLNFDHDPLKSDVGFLSVEDIQRNLDFFQKPAAKAFSSYIRDYDVANSTELFLVPVPGAIQQNEPALVTSRGLLISAICLFLIATALIVINLFYLNIWRTPPFKLEALMGYIAKHLQKSEKDSERSDSTSHLPSDSSRTQLRKLLAQLAGFIIIEAAFFGLVLVCSRNPIFINIPLPTAEMKGGFTVISILWQALAIFLLSEATALAFSSEWSLQHAKTGRLIPGVTDRVSRLSSGNDDKSRYFFTRMPSISFRVAFLVSLVLTALSSFAPGSLNVSEIKSRIESPLKVADLRLLTTSQAAENGNNLNFILTRANTLVLMEHFDDSLFKYVVEPNWVAAWPDETSIDSRVVGNMEYPTDVVHFNYSCAWRIPKMGSHNSTTTWTVDGQSWGLWGLPITGLVYRGGVLPLHRNVDIQPDGLSAYLFVGTNDSFPVDPDETKRSIINLGNIPTLFHPSGFKVNASESNISRWISPLSTILLCDPRIEASGGRAQLSPSKEVNVTASGLPPVGNIPPDAVNTIFTQAMLKTLDTDDDTDARWAGFMGLRAFVTDSTKNFTGFPRGAPIYNLSTMVNNLNAFTLSASKAFLDGFYVDGNNRSDLTIQKRSVVGLGEVEKPVLVGVKTLGLISLCLSFAAAVGFGLLVFLLSANPGTVFELRNIMQAVQETK